MRRFLDGYYPMRLTLDIEYPAASLRFEAQEPQPQPGFQVERRSGRIQAEIWFEGRLITRFVFCRKESPRCPLTLQFRNDADQTADSQA